MSNPYRVLIVNKVTVKKGYLCPICHEYKKTKTCECGDMEICVDSFKAGSEPLDDDATSAYVSIKVSGKSTKKAKKRKSKDLG